MTQEKMQAPQELPQEADQDQMIVEFLQELDARITALEELNDNQGLDSDKNEDND
jgi:predicted extracellular nuclease